MIGKIIAKTRGRPCSCPEGKQCDGCKTKRVIKPSVYIEEPRRLPAPIRVERYRDYPTKASFVVTRKQPKQHKPSAITQWYRRRQENKQSKSGSPLNNSPICRWYKRQKELKELKAIRKREQKIELEKARQQREIEVLRYIEKEERAKRAREKELEKEQKKKEEEIYEIFRKQAETARKAELEEEQKKKEEEVYEIFRKQAEAEARRKPALAEDHIVTVPIKPLKYKKVKEKKVKKFKEKKTKLRSTKAGPRRLAKIKQKLPCDVRFVNCCYRFCCQFYCWLTILLLLGLGIMLYL